MVKFSLMGHTTFAYGQSLPCRSFAIIRGKAASLCFPLQDERLCTFQGKNDELHFFWSYHLRSNLLWPDVYSCCYVSLINKNSQCSDDGGTAVCRACSVLI